MGVWPFLTGRPEWAIGVQKVTKISLMVIPLENIVCDNKVMVFQ